MPRGRKPVTEPIPLKDQSIDNQWTKTNDGWLPPEPTPWVRPVVRRLGYVRSTTAGAMTHADVGKAVKPLAGGRRGDWLAIDALQLMPEQVYVHLDGTAMEHVVVLHPDCPVLVCDRLTIAPTSPGRGRQAVADPDCLTA